MSRMRSVVSLAVDVVVGGSVREARRVEAEARRVAAEARRVAAEAAARSVMRDREGAGEVIR